MPKQKDPNAAAMESILGGMDDDETPTPMGRRGKRKKAKKKDIMDIVYSVMGRPKMPETKGKAKMY